VAGEGVGLDEGPGVQEELDPLPGRQLPALVLPLDRLGPAGDQGILLALLEVLDLALDGPWFRLLAGLLRRRHRRGVYPVIELGIRVGGGV
jgi:hypothetical protein